MQYIDDKFGVLKKVLRVKTRVQVARVVKKGCGFGERNQR
jgi:hypothetical protein